MLILSLKFIGPTPSDVEEAISFDPDEPSLWMDDDTIEIITGRSNSTVAATDSIFEEEISLLPHAGFVCGIPMQNTDQENNTRIISLILDEGKLDSPRPHRYEINAKILDEKGKSDGDGKFVAQIVPPNTTLVAPNFRCINIEIESGIRKTGFGFLLYIIDGDLYARRIGKNQAKKAYQTLKRKSMQNTGPSTSPFEPNFIGADPPYDGSQTRSWTVL